MYILDKKDTRYVILISFNDIPMGVELLKMFEAMSCPT